MAESATAANSGGKPAIGAEQDQFRVGCIVDIPTSPHIPPMRIGKHSLVSTILPCSVWVHAVSWAKLSCPVVRFGAFCCFDQRTLTASQRRLCCLVLRSRSPRTRMLFSHGIHGCAR